MTLRQLFDEHAWLTLSNDGVVRCPFLVKGRLVEPPTVSLETIARAFAGLDAGRGSADSYASYVAVSGAQVLRHREIDRQTMRGTDRWIYTVMPRVDARDLVETDIEGLTNELYSIPHESMLEWLTLVSTALERESDLVAQVRDLDRLTSEHPDAFGSAAFLAFPFLLSPDIATASVDAELSHQGIGGRRLLDEWVEMPATRVAGPVHFIGSDILPDALASELHSYKALVRAMPTRQLHITAGNSPLVPMLSLLRHERDGLEPWTADDQG